MKRNKAIDTSAKPLVQTGTPATSAEQKLTLTGIQQANKALSPKEAYAYVSQAYAAINAIKQQISKVQIRHFNANGDEIISPELEKLYTHQLVERLTGWWCVAGEAVMGTVKNKATGQPTPPIALDPTLLYEEPYGQCYDINDVTGWSYRLSNFMKHSSVQVEYPTKAIVFRANFNPLNSLRGLSPLIVAQNEASSLYFTARFNKQFFENGSVGDLVFRFPKGTKKADAKDFLESWTRYHGVYNDSGFRLAGLIGDEIQIEQIGTQARDGQFLQLSQSYTNNIAMTFKVPAVEMGIYDRTRYETAPVEREIFAENTCMPLLHVLTGMMQEFNDKWDISSVGTRKVKAKLSHLTTQALTKALDGQTDKNRVYTICDPDTLPIMGKIKESKFKLCKDIREGLDLSANEAASMLGIEIPNRPERDEIWVPSNRINISTEVAEAQKQLKALDAKVSQLQAEDQPVVLNESEKSQMQAMQEYYKAIRATVLDAMDHGTPLLKRNLTDVLPEALKANEAVLDRINEDYLHLMSLKNDQQTEVTDKIREAKTYLNRVSKPSSLKAIWRTIND